MKITNTLGCADKPCDCGCSDCNDSKPKTTSTRAQVSPVVKSTQSGYRKPSPEDYLPSYLETKSSGYNKKGDVVLPSGFNKKKIVRSDSAPKIIVTHKSTLKTQRQDHTGIYIAGGVGLLLLLAVLCSDKKEKR